MNSIPISLDDGIETPKYQDFVAFTSTFYKDDVEGRIRSEACFEMLDNAQKLGIRIVVGDGGSGKEFLERVSKYPNVTLIHSGKGGENPDLTMAGERRFTGKIAMDSYPDSKFFLWLEPEKAEIMKAESIDAILTPMKDTTADIVVPSRISKDTLPHQQRSAENRANLRALDIIKHGEMRPIHNLGDQGVMIGFDFNGKPSIYGDPYFGTKEQYKDGSLDTTIGENYEDVKGLDLWFGPKAFTRESMEQDFLPYKGSKWDGIITPVLAGKLRGKNVVDIPVDFSYPPKQTKLETDPEQAMKYQKLRRIQYRYIIKTIKKLIEQNIEKNSQS